jgi:ribosomal protein L40E
MPPTPNSPSPDFDNELSLSGQRCPACNTRNSPTAASCSFCGHALVPMVATAGEAQPGATAPPPRTTGRPSNKTLPPTPAQPRFDANGNRLCSWCGAANPPQAESCVVCRASFPVPGREMEYNKALLQLQLEQVRVASDEAAAGRRRLNRWRWAAWALSRVWRGPGM